MVNSELFSGFKRNFISVYTCDINYYNKLFVYWDFFGTQQLCWSWTNCDDQTPDVTSDSDILKGIAFWAQCQVAFF